MPTVGLEDYESPRQRTRIASEAWGEANLFCVNCDSPELMRTRANTPAIDFACPICSALFQLKSQRRKLGRSLSDGAYEKMRETIAADKTPNLLALHYEPEQWKVRNLILIPRFSYSLSVIKKRGALKPQARRHGWVGCTILLGEIPQEVRISIVSDGTITPTTEIRKQYRRLKKLGSQTVEARGWTLDVLRVVQSLGKNEFSLKEVYQFEADLARLHPENRHVQQKIRQQLQFLRNMGIVQFLGSGSYRLG